MFSLFRSKTLQDVLNQTKKVKVGGIKFVIKKLDPIDTMSGAAILQKSYDTYEVGAKDAPVVQQKPEKVKAYFREIFLSCVVEPKLYRDQEQAKTAGGVWVDGMFTEWDLVEGLHMAILGFTYGKKKMKLLGSLKPT